MLFTGTATAFSPRTAVLETFFAGWTREREAMRNKIVPGFSIDSGAEIG